jgi:hypothetical protein
VYIWTQLPGPRNVAGAALLTTSTLLWTGVRPHSRGRAHPLRPGRGVHDDVAESHQRAATSPAAARLLQESCRPSAVLAACSQEKLLPPPARLSGPFQCAHAPARSTAVSLAGTVLQAAGGRAAIAVADRRRLAGPRLVPRCPSLAARPSLPVPRSLATDRTARAASKAQIPPRTVAQNHSKSAGCASIAGRLVLGSAAAAPPGSATPHPLWRWPTHRRRRRSAFC